MVTSFHRARRAWPFCLVVLFFSISARFAGAQGYSPEDAVRRMMVADRFQVELVTAEPFVRQPVAIDFDDRGRLWVLQYLQYPNPAGLKRVSVDRYSRTKYDRVPKPPPQGPKGADRLTILEDTDGDGRVDKSKDFLSDLNIATGFAFGYGGVFVLQTPYLLFYPDRNRDDVPDGDPEVLLKGFGMEDTSSLANSMLFGPDGWLYGTQGTNITANIRGHQFEQGLWRYHPVTKRFELFAEGGSNMWGLDFDRQGNLLAGTNYGGYLLFHGIQGAYYQKSFAKHGELHNPFAFGYFKHAPHKNFQGGHVTVGGFLYQGNAFPPGFRNKYIAVDTLGHAVRWHHVKPHASTVRTENGGVLLQANDTWFAPSDSVQGPDGAVYIADWYDQRTAHPDPDATWDRSNGRVYRLKAKDAKPPAHVDPQALPSEKLIDWLTDTNEWKVRRARRVLAERDDGKVVDTIAKRLREANDARAALQYLWTLHGLGGLKDDLIVALLEHRDPVLRAWTIRLLADGGTTVSDTGDKEFTASTGALQQQLLHTARNDSSPVVIRQLASTAKRLTPTDGLPIARAIADRREFASDPCIPLLMWWAVERRAVSHADAVLRVFADDRSWQNSFVRDVILGRLMRRYAGDGSEKAFQACAKLLASAPASQHRRMISELDAGLKMLGRKRIEGLPLPDSQLALKKLPGEKAAGQLKSVPPALAETLKDIWRDDTTDPLTIRVSARLGSASAIERAIALATDKQTPEALRLSTFAILGELGGAKACVEPALQLVSSSQPDSIQLAALRLLGRFSDSRITPALLSRYGMWNPSLRTAARGVLLSRADSAVAFLKTIDAGKLPKTDVTPDELRQVALHNHQEIDALVRKHWGSIRPGTPEEKLAEIRRLNNDLRAGSGNAAAGKLVFDKTCASCHKLFGAGKEIGPDLTKANRGDRNFLLVSMVDPSAQIRKEYISHVVLTENGRVVTGLMVEETQAGVTLLGAKNERTTIPAEDILKIKPSAVSLMPEDLLKDLKPQQLRDLMSYLQSKGKPPAAGDAKPSP